MILNGKNTPLNQSGSNLPQVTAAITGWFKPMTFGVTVKTNVDFLTVDEITDVSCQGVWQPFTDQQLAIKPEGERSWKWFMIHSDPSLVLTTDDQIQYQGVNYDVMGKKDYKEYGYVQYEVVNKYEVT